MSTIGQPERALTPNVFYVEFCDNEGQGDDLR
jgi:hypothetical protein